ncbi:unnamed protein product [Psylliodes chrysocephalus]|uniref:Uncharacterized protein n=1 Tax=Psylliodes chrysocephalus TaxID=3402493 RepID=A0A9P0GH86_9CUCU|nr:unnamed protein product [Psylliodes chrysocephala]
MVYPYVQLFIWFEFHCLVFQTGFLDNSGIFYLVCYFYIVCVIFIFYILYILLSIISLCVVMINMELLVFTIIKKTLSPRAGAEYFEKILDNEITKIETICDKWEKYKAENEMAEETTNMINVATGQPRLIIAKKFEQFRGLINQCKLCTFKDQTCRLRVPIVRYTGVLTLNICEDFRNYGYRTFLTGNDISGLFYLLLLVLLLMTTAAHCRAMSNIPLLFLSVRFL